MQNKKDQGLQLNTAINFKQWFILFYGL